MPLEERKKKGTIMTQCTADLVKDEKAKANAYNKIPFMKDFWQSPDDPC